MAQRRSPTGKLAGLAAAVLLALWAAGGRGADAPHTALCSDCHINHDQFGKQYESTAGNANLCLSCHTPGGTASATALWDGDQAAPAPGVGANVLGRGRSHRWDSSASGRIVPLVNAPQGSFEPRGKFTGRYAKSYTITMTTGGSTAQARFSWVADPPGTGSGSNLPLVVRVPVDVDAEGWVTYETHPASLELGLSLSFFGTPVFRAGDSWRLYVRPDLDLPSDPNLLWCMTEGTTSCSVCHDQHSQALEPFDPAAPASGAGRHFMRADNSTDQMCAECHGARFVTNALAGSHPVGVRVPTNSAYRSPASLPLDKEVGAMRCSTCHQVHHSAGTDGNLLRAATDSWLCHQCHQPVDVVSALHAQPVDKMLWPGGQYGSQCPTDTDPQHRGSCGNCHRTHGWPDPASATNNYPTLLVEREEALCYTCHDGSPATRNLMANFNKSYRHPVATSGRHTVGEDGKPAAYGTANRHAECADCHNVHLLKADAAPAVPPAASGNLQGTPRVSVTNLSPGVVAYTFRGPGDPTPAKEYEVCFTCHSSWTTQPSGQSNLAADFNELNASFHPVEALGKNTYINPGAFVNGWSASKTMACSDCHTSDDISIRGPHGSAYQYILKKLAIASPARRGTAMPSTELCFDCHNYNTYANGSSSSTIQNYSRFSGEHGHADHVGDRRYPCYSCHETHGTTTLPNLLVTGRSPGLNSYTRTATGGTCNATCHGNESYTVTYPR